MFWAFLIGIVAVVAIVSYVGIFFSFFILMLVVTVLCVYGSIMSEGERRRLAYIESYQFNNAIGEKVQKKYPHLSNEQVEKVLLALKDYFHICCQARLKMVAMPSQVVDVAWHEFILHTRQYQAFCEKALGRFLHHTPTEAMSSPTVAQDGIKRAWLLACQKNGIDPHHATSLPPIFAIDSELAIEDGFTYSLNCTDKSSPVYGVGYCTAHIACVGGYAAGSDADSSGGGGDCSGGSDGGSSGCGGGCGGGGCGGGGGGS